MAGVTKTFGRSSVRVSLDGAEIVLEVETKGAGVMLARSPVAQGAAAAVAKAFASKLLANMAPEERARLRGEARGLVNQALV